MLPPLGATPPHNVIEVISLAIMNGILRNFQNLVYYEWIFTKFSEFSLLTRQSVLGEKC